MSELQRRRLDAYFSSLEQQPAHNEKVTQWLAVANTTGQGNAYTHQEDENDETPHVYRTRGGGGKDSQDTPSEDLQSVSQKTATNLLDAIMTLSS
jgi:hypothetical protein